MKKALKYILSFTVCLLQSLIASAQNLPLLPADPAILRGVLPNGMSYYLVTNPTTDGVADFALVQRTGTADIGEQARDVAREALSSLPRLSAASTQSFLTSHGAAPGRNGFVKVTENSTLYHFDNIVLAEENIDSVLVVLMDIVDRGTANTEPLWEWYAPQDQAVVISGDIDASVIANKLKMLSYMTPSRKSKERKAHVWNSTDVPEFEVVAASPGKFVTVTATWRSPRTPEEYMNTVQPAIFSMFVNELGVLAKERISRNLRQNDIPVASVSYNHINSSRSCGDESFSISVAVSPEHLTQAVEVLASTMASLDRGTASEHEFLMAKRRCLEVLEERSERLIRLNTDYVDRCVSSFLYNASLSSSKEVHTFLKNRDLDVATELRHFSRIASAILDGNKNLKVRCVTDGTPLTTEQLQTIFLNAWNSDVPAFVCRSPLDSMTLPAPVTPVKLKSYKKEPLSGGVEWTFANGFKVIYKRQEAGRRMYYSLALNGGYGNIKGLSAGEGAYISDYISLSEVAGMKSEDFHLALEKNDIELETVVNLSNTMIHGNVPESDVAMLMQILLAYMNERKGDDEAFDYYRSCLGVEREFIRGSVRDRILAIDALMCPEYEYSQLKLSGGISDDFTEKVDEFWAYQAGKTNDGVLVLVGNMEETKLRKLLQNYIGGFATTDRTYPRVNVSYQVVSGSTTYDLKGDKNSIDVALSTRQSLTAENYFASNIAAGVLKQMISREIAETGMYLRLSHNCRIYPQERLNMLITLEEADPMGFAADVTLAGAEAALRKLRTVLADLPQFQINEADVRKYKAVLKGHMAVMVQDPQYWTQAIAMRYLDGKDLTTSYSSKIDGITTAKVKSILVPLSTTTRIEYIIEK